MIPSTRRAQYNWITSIAYYDSTMWINFSTSQWKKGLADSNFALEVPEEFAGNIFSRYSQIEGYNFPCCPSKQPRISVRSWKSSRLIPHDQGIWSPGLTLSGRASLSLVRFGGHRSRVIWHFLVVDGLCLRRLKMEEKDGLEQRLGYSMHWSTYERHYSRGERDQSIETRMGFPH